MFKCFSALIRDRDELAAALEVRDRIKYDLNTPEREEILSTGDLIIEVSNYKNCHLVDERKDHDKDIT